MAEAMMRRVRRAVRWVRGQYFSDGGLYVVTARRWWSPKERKAARMAAKLVSLQEEQVALKAQRLMLQTLLYGQLVDRR